MAVIVTASLRAHHIALLYLDLIENEKMSRKLKIHHNEFILKYPLTVTTTTDPTCDRCMPFPVINFCRGPQTRRLDELAAERLDIEIGRAYTEEYLRALFKRKAREHGFKIGRQYEWDEFEDKFYRMRNAWMNV
ncbi:MAG: hypothetical protein AABY16_01740 [Nanoarchaeota archaeon]